MSVVAWDGTSLAADGLAVNAEMREPSVKILQHDSGAILASTGTASHFASLVQWWSAGAGAAAHLPWQADATDWTRLIVATPETLRVYERWGLPLTYAMEAPMAWGSGRDFAMGALAMGANAQEAVRVACRFSVLCGGACTAYRVR